MLSHLSLVNKLLRRLRENTVATVTETTYSRLVSQFINDAKREVEDSWQWSVLVKSFDLTSTANSSAILAWPSSLSPRARLVVDPNHNTSVLSLSSPNVTRLDVVDVNTYLTEKLSANITPIYGPPTSVNLVRNPSVLTTENRNPFAWQFWPYPDAAYTITTYVVDPQSDLSADADILLIPDGPVEMKAYLYLLYERGEELGEYIGLVSAKADAALADAVTFDQMQNWPNIQFHL